MTREEQEKVMQELIDEEQEETSEEEQEEAPEKEQSSEEKVLEPVNNSEYKCFTCSKIISEQYIKKKVRCPYCGSKIIFKARTKPNTVVAR
jgi:DNA-directed RNA polymerase subunit RPC12/RpoP